MTVKRSLGFRRLFAVFFLTFCSAPAAADETARRFLAASYPTARICDVLLRVVPAEGGRNVTPAEGGGDVVPADGGGLAFGSVDGRGVAPADFNPNLDVSPRRVSFDLAFDPSLLGGTQVVNPSVGRIDYDIASRVMRLDGRIIGVADQNAFALWCAEIEDAAAPPAETGPSEEPTGEEPS